MRHRLCFFLAVAAAAGLLLGVVPALGPGVLMAAPALLLALPLLVGRYPGADRLARAARTAKPASRRPPAPAMRSGQHAPLLPRGGQLIARGLAVRPPPAALAR